MFSKTFFQNYFYWLMFVFENLTFQNFPTIWYLRGTFTLHVDRFHNLDLLEIISILLNQIPKLHWYLWKFKEMGTLTLSYKHYAVTLSKSMSFTTNTYIWNYIAVHLLLEYKWNKNIFCVASYTHNLTVTALLNINPWFSTWKIKILSTYVYIALPIPIYICCSYIHT